MEDQAFELLMLEIKYLRHEVEELKKFRWMHAGVIVSLSVLSSLIVSVATMVSKFNIGVH